MHSPRFWTVLTMKDLLSFADDMVAPPQTGKAFKEPFRQYHGPPTACVMCPSLVKTPALPPHQFCTASALLGLTKQQMFASMCKRCGPRIHWLVIAFLFLLLFLKAVFKPLTVFLVFITFYCRIPLWVVFWHRLGLMNFQLQWFNLIQTHIGV